MTISTKVVPEMMKKKDDSSTTNRVDDNNSNSVNDNTNDITPSTSEIIVTSNDKNDKKLISSENGENTNDISSVETSSDTKEGAAVVSQACAPPKPCSPISNVSSSLMQEVNESNVENQSTVMTPVLVMSSDEKAEPNVGVKDQAGNNIGSEVKSKKLNDSKYKAPSVHEEKRKREIAETEGESCISTEDTKKRKTESSSLDQNVKTLETEANPFIIDIKKNGTNNSQHMEDKNMKMLVRSSPKASIEKSAPDPRNSQISALIKHRKDLLDRMRFCQEVCHMRLQKQQKGLENDDEIGAFKQLSQHVLQST